MACFDSLRRKQDTDQQVGNVPPHPEWVSDPATGLFPGFGGGFAKLVPDLEWAVQDMHQDGDTVVVRRHATGAPAGLLFGVDGEGRLTDILTIDFHKLADGVIAQSYHVEDWAGALRQPSGK
ncbi:ester cyclase [Leisingera sp. ANG-M7]|uniref:ester cyclase n=1 Tax=Leisingera sp. ANG-M7 TaxID=1577902 RepID=UPI0023AA1D02|nr:ester cyclase [Leisingera sp. ANG-M7]